jgi:hypothetical protein
MSSWFGPKKTPKELAKEAKRETKREVRVRTCFFTVLSGFVIVIDDDVVKT